MRTTTTLIIGAGQAGLAMSHHLTERSIDHVLLERGDVASSWRRGRWDSLRLLTPNWQSRLPGFRYDGDDPDGFMTMPEVIDYLTSYAATIAAPVETNTTVTSLHPNGDGYHVTTTEGEWRARTVVLATGACTVADVPAIAAAVPRGGHLAHPRRLPQPRPTARRRRADRRRVRHRGPARRRDPPFRPARHAGHRGSRARAAPLSRDGHHVVARRVGHPRRALRPSRRHRPRSQPALVPAGRLIHSRDDRPQRAAARSASGWSVGSPASTTASPSCPARCATCAPSPTSSSVDCSTRSTSGPTVMASAVRPNHLIAFRRRRSSRHPSCSSTSAAATSPRSSGRPATGPTTLGSTCPSSTTRVGSATTAGSPSPPGLYVVGLPFLRRRKSTLIDGAGDDARDLCAHLAAHLDRRSARRHQRTAS